MEMKNRKWNIREVNTKYDIFTPPSDMGFSETYKLYIYNKYENHDFDSGLTKVIDIISQIYSEDSDELASIVIEDKQTRLDRFEEVFIS